MGASPAVLCSAWLAEPRFPARVYVYGSTALPFLLYSGSAVAIEVPESLTGAFSHHAWLHEFPAPSAGPQTGQFGRSEAEAKLHLWGLDPDPEATVASCEAIRGPDHVSLGLALPTRPRSIRSLATGFDSFFIGAVDPKRLLTYTVRLLRLSPAARTQVYVGKSSTLRL